MAENRVIGRDNEVPWHLPDDLRHFKRLTTGHSVIMGRRTFDSIDRRPLPDRRNIILTRDPAFRSAGIQIVGSLKQGLALTKGEDEVFIAGGEAIYRLALPLADRMYLTIVHAVVEGDAQFPEFDPSEWRLVSHERHDADTRHRFAFSFHQYDRKRTR